MRCAGGDATLYTPRAASTPPRGPCVDRTGSLVLRHLSAFSGRRWRCGWRGWASCVRRVCGAAGKAEPRERPRPIQRGQRRTHPGTVSITATSPASPARWSHPTPHRQRCARCSGFQFHSSEPPQVRRLPDWVGTSSRSPRHPATHTHGGCLRTRTSGRGKAEGKARRALRHDTRRVRRRPEEEARGWRGGNSPNHPHPRASES
jgi:hypothetical protein